MNRETKVDGQMLEVHARRNDRSRQFERFLNLLWALVVREFKGRYRRSILGPGWAFLQPLLYMIIFVFLRGILSIDSEGVPYILFVYSALVLWTFFANAVSWSGPSVFRNRSVVKKMAMPREVFPTSAVATALVDFPIAFVILVGMMVWFGVSFGWTILWLPVIVLLTLLLALGIGMGLAALGTFKQDILLAIPFVLTLWLLATPVIYPLSQVPQDKQALLMLNPMTGLIEGFRGVIVSNSPPDLQMLGISILGIAIVWLVAWPLFRYLSQYYADVM